MRTEPYADLCRVLTDLPTTLAESVALLPRNLAATATPSVAAEPGARQPENDRALAERLYRGCRNRHRVMAIRSVDR